MYVAVNTNENLEDYVLYNSYYNNLSAKIE